MAKIIFTADTMMSILKKVFEDEDLETIVETDREEWKDKTLAQILNIDLYTHKHAVPSTIEIKDELMAQGEDSNRLDVLKRSFCLVSLEEVQRLYSKDIDQIAVSGTLQFWLQAEKVKLLEAFIEAVNIALCGEKLTINIQGETRKATLFFGRVSSNIDGQTEIGESAIATVNVTIMITPNVVSYSDYLVEFLMSKVDSDNESEYVELPITNIQFGNMMTGKAVPLTRDKSRTMQTNLSNTTLLTLVYDGYIDNRVVQMFVYDSFSKAATNVDFSDRVKNNKEYIMRLTRLGQAFIYNLRIQDHKITVSNDTGNELHTISFTIGG